MMNLSISVIVCTHNPRRDYLDQVLNALKSQTLSIEQWELLLIDNLSDRVLADEIDLTWHPHARHIREEELGLTPARLRGMLDSQADLLVFVDDDNVLNPDYLEVALGTAQRWAMMGAWGGQAIPAFDEPPPDWTKPYWPCLAIEEFEQDCWSSFVHPTTFPRGAGLCIRRSVAQAYLELVKSQPLRLHLDRRGKSLVSGGDSDIARVAIQLGMGMGKFQALKLTHLMPKERLQEDYLLKLYEAMHYTGVIFYAIEGNPAGQTRRGRLLQYVQRWFRDMRSRRFHDAARRGIELGLKDLPLLQTQDPGLSV